MDESSLFKLCGIKLSNENGDGVTRLSRRIVNKEFVKALSEYLFYRNEENAKQLLDKLSNSVIGHYSELIEQEIEQITEEKL